MSKTDLCPEYVACPICTRQIPEADINLHLDLQCPGEATTSRKASQGSIKTSPKQEVIDILDTPPKRGNDGAGSGQGNVASIFASRKRVKLEDKAEVEDAQPTPSINERKRPPQREQNAGKGMTQGMEKKPRINPLTANQP
jgi:putative ATPase